jgi:hypothetical protein
VDEVEACGVERLVDKALRDTFAGDDVGLEDARKKSTLKPCWRFENHRLRLFAVARLRLTNGMASYEKPGCRGGREVSTGGAHR